uniref:Uncharacterized protein n=1 Tax=Populus davidiana TaxID=266767 RepID=A0A6M2F926_9ROSI
MLHHSSDNQSSSMSTSSNTFSGFCNCLQHHLQKKPQIIFCFPPTTKLKYCYNSSYSKKAWPEGTDPVNIRAIETGPLHISGAISEQIEIMEFKHRNGYQDVDRKAIYMKLQLKRSMDDP